MSVTKEQYDLALKQMVDAGLIKIHSTNSNGESLVEFFPENLPDFIKTKKGEWDNE